jgi:hypothetical protein
MVVSLKCLFCSEVLMRFHVLHTIVSLFKYASFSKHFQIWQFGMYLYLVSMQLIDSQIGQECCYDITVKLALLMFSVVKAIFK